jgi:cysteine synthase A
MFTRVARVPAAALVTAGGLALLSANEPAPQAAAKITRRSSAAMAADTIQENNIDGCIGDTKLVYLKSLSEETKCKIYGKAEYQNPSGSVKDRTVMGIIQDAERNGRLQPGGTIVEGTGGNTGISLSQLGAAKGYKVILTAPSNVSKEKIDHCERFGAEVVLAPKEHSYDHPDNYARKAERIAAEIPGALYANQFENLANYRVHFATTGPEIYAQTNGAVDAFVCSSGTGGSIGGVSSFLKLAKPDCKAYIIDPQGSILFDYVTNGTEQSTGSTEIEGIGADHITDNFKQAELDGAVRGTDQEAVNMAYYMQAKEGLFIGPSAALNLVGAVKIARKLGPGHTIVTLLCDGGDRYMSKLYNKDWLHVNNLTPSRLKDLNFVSYTPILSVKKR